MSDAVRQLAQEKHELEGKQLVEIRKDGAVGIVLLDDPGALNPISTHAGGMEDQIVDAIVEFEGDPDVRVIVIGANGRAFSSGADFRGPSLGVYGNDGQIQRALAKLTTVDEQRNWSMWYVLDNVSKPLVAAVHGWAIGGGWEIAMWCDLIFADRTAKFSLTQAKVGLPPAFATHFLSRACGRWKAAELCYSGRVVEAEEAEALGLVTRLVDEGKDLEAAIEAAKQMAESDPALLSAIRGQLMRATLTTPEWELNRRDFTLVRLSDAYRDRMMRWRDSQGKTAGISEH